MEIGRREREVERERGEELEIETGRNRDREIEKQRETRRQGDTEESYRTTKEKTLFCFPVWVLF